jgi:hypothetical protein
MTSIRFRALNSAAAFARLLRRLRRKRRDARVHNLKTRGPRRALTALQRSEVLTKTAGRCHICGGRIRRSERWEADHILAYAHGGQHSVDNYLPAHAECNSYRRHFTAEEFAWVLKLGVWFRHKIEKDDPVAIQLAERFAKHHTGLKRRRVAV